MSWLLFCLSRLFFFLFMNSFTWYSIRRYIFVRYTIRSFCKCPMRRYICSFSFKIECFAISVRFALTHDVRIYDWQIHSAGIRFKSSMSTDSSGNYNLFGFIEFKSHEIAKYVSKFHLFVHESSDFKLVVSRIMLTFQKLFFISDPKTSFCARTHNMHGMAAGAQFCIKSFSFLLFFFV